MVALAGDRDQVVYRHRGVPIMFPELPILQHIHGDDAITEVFVVGHCEMSNDEALGRVRIIYGAEAVNDVFPGARPRLPTSDDGIPLCQLPIHVAPPTKPDNPDPKLRPLDQFTMTDAMPRVEAQPFVEDEPTADEIAAHRLDDDDEPVDASPFEVQAVVPDNMGDISRPVVEDQPHGRTSFRGQARQAPRTESHLPDVVHTPPTTGRGNHDHDRPRG